jgi:hypothetical protein
VICAACAKGACNPVGYRESRMEGSKDTLFNWWPEAVLLQVFFEIFTLNLDGAAQLHARDLPAAQASVDPALAHPQLLAEFLYREQTQGSPLWQTLLSLTPDGLFALQERALQLFEDFAVTS